MQNLLSSEMASLFGTTNPFLTPVGKKIEQATDANLPSENWELNMAVCDLINENEEGAKDAMKAIRKRLAQNAGRNAKTVMYTLTVLETCVKNCGRRFHVLVCQKDFLQELLKVILPKNEPPAVMQEKVLSLVQSWADAFRDIPELSAVVQFYQELKVKQKIEFPMTDLDNMAPIHTPQRSLPEEPAPVPVTVSCPVVENVPSNASLTAEQKRKLSQELLVVEGNMTVLSEMLSELTPGSEHPSDLQLLLELHSTCQAMQQRLVELISQLSNDEITENLLRINDGLNNLFLRFGRYDKKRLASKVAPQNETQQLISLDDDTPDIAGAASLSSQLAEMSLASQLSSIPSVNAANNKDDEFDMFAQSRKATYESSKLGSSTYEANHEPALSGSLGALAQARAAGSSATVPLPVPDLVGVHSERDFNEMAEWLGEKTEESLTSNEFDKFLADRAAAAEVLPPSTTRNNSSTNSDRKSSKSEEKPMLAL